MVENHMAGEGLGEPGVLAFLDLRADIHIVEDTLAGGGTLADHVEDMHQLTHGVGNHPQIAEDNNHIAGCESAALGQPAANQQHGRRESGGDEFNDGMIITPDYGNLDTIVAVLAVLFSEVFLLRIGLDDANAGDVLLGLGVEGGTLITHLDEGRTDGTVKLVAHKGKYRCEHQEQSGQLGRDGEDHDHSANEMNGLFYNGNEAARNEVADGIHIAGQTGHDLTDTMMVVETERQLVQMLKKRLTDGEDNTLRDVLENETTQIEQQCLNGKQ